MPSAQAKIDRVLNFIACGQILARNQPRSFRQEYGRTILWYCYRIKLHEELWFCGRKFKVRRVEIPVKNPGELDSKNTWQQGLARVWWLYAGDSPVRSCVHLPWRWNWHWAHVEERGILLESTVALWHRWKAGVPEIPHRYVMLPLENPFKIAHYLKFEFFVAGFIAPAMQTFYNGFTQGSQDICHFWYGVCPGAWFLSPLEYFMYSNCID